MQNQARTLMEYKNKQIVQFCFKNLEKIKKNLQMTIFGQTYL